MFPTTENVSVDSFNQALIDISASEGTRDMAVFHEQI